MTQARTDQFLLQTILKGVSRSFYLTLAVLPKPVRTQVGLAYLFARAADTITDTGSLDDPIRAYGLSRLKAQFSDETFSWEAIQNLSLLVAPSQQNPHEKLLLEALEDCFRLYEQLSPDDQKRIARVLRTLIEGMEFDLGQFPRHVSDEVTALSDLKDLDDYTFAVAGCVGEFWTQMMCAHVPGMAHWDCSVMAPIGIRYGKGLQLVNILRDVPQDLRRGRCYIPAPLLREVGLRPHELLDQASVSTFRPVLRQLVAKAMDHLDQGWRYTLAIPPTEVRLRLACMWPVLIGIRTLNKLVATENFLDPRTPVKVSRGEIYRMMALTTLTGGSGYVGTAYWGYLRKPIV